MADDLPMPPGWRPRKRRVDTGRFAGLSDADLAAARPASALEAYQRKVELRCRYLRRGTAKWWQGALARQGAMQTDPPRAPADPPA